MFIPPPQTKKRKEKEIRTLVPWQQQVIFILEPKLDRVDFVDLIKIFILLQVKLRENAMVLMMGTKDEDMPSMPVEKTKFVEDMDEHELNKALEMPAGIY